VTTNSSEAFLFRVALALEPLLIGGTQGAQVASRWTVELESASGRRVSGHGDLLIGGLSLREKGERILCGR
jgi:hypothetical protein